MSSARLSPRNNNILIATGAVLVTAYGGLRIYRSAGERRYPTRSVQSLPRASAIRTLFDERPPAPLAGPAASREPPPVLVEPLGRWLPTSTAPSHVIPRETLERYARARLAPDRAPSSDSERLDIQTLTEAAMLALGDSLAHRFEVRLGVRGHTAFSLEPGEDERTAIRPGRGHWNDDFTVFGSWSTSPSVPMECEPIQAVVSDGMAPEPPCRALSNSKRLKLAAANGEPDAGGVLLYWRNQRLDNYAIFKWLIKPAMKATNFNFPLGGLHEVIVEDLPERNARGEELVKITYATAEVYDLRPNGEEENWNVMPDWARALHVDYARSMLKGAIAQIVRHP